MSLFCSQVNGVYLILDRVLLCTPILLHLPGCWDYRCGSTRPCEARHLDEDSWKPQTSTLLFSNCPDPPESHGLGLSPKAKSVGQPCGLDGEFQTPFSAAAEAGTGFGHPETHGKGPDWCGGACLYLQHGRG